MTNLRPGPTNSLSDVAGLRVGHAIDQKARTGASVVLCESMRRASVTIPGGGPGTREVALLDQGRLVGGVDAIVLSGGSAFGLAAADGVCEALREDGRGFTLIPRPGIPATPIVSGAILYDLANGGDKNWGERSPYFSLGVEAYADAKQNPKQAVKLGGVGAGLGARAGAGLGGLGSASIKFMDYTIGALSAVNSFGSVRIPGQSAFWAAPYEIDGEFGGQLPVYENAIYPGDWGAAKINPMPGGNTTLALVAVDAPLSTDDLNRLLQMAQTGMARAIRPIFTPFDGDIIFGLSSPIEARAESIDPLVLAQMGELAAQTLCRAIARAVYEAERTMEHIS